MKPLHIYVDVDDYEFLREQSFKSKQSISRLVGDLIRDTRKISQGLTDVRPVQKQIRTAQEKKNINLCKHGAMKGLCKQGCQ